MDFQENKQTEVPADNARSSENNNGPSCPDGQSYGNHNGSPYQNGQPYGNHNGSPYQNGQPYQNRPPYGNGAPYPAPQQPYGNHANMPGQNNGPYRGNTPYGNQYPNRNGQQGGGDPDTNNYDLNHFYQNNRYNNNYPYYDRNSYRIPVAEPGSSLAKAAMICGILSIIFCLTFTVYPAFVLGSVAIILALLSKGRRSSLFTNARTGIICATIGLIFNAILVTSSVAYVFTNPEQMEKFNEQWEQIYGVPFDDMMDDIMENNGY